MSSKPWEAIGMSRATWYRHGKPTEKPQLIMDLSYTAIAGRERVSVRTVQRMHRVLGADAELARAVREGLGKWGQAEWLIKHPKAHRKWRKANGLPWPVPELELDDF